MSPAPAVNQPTKWARAMRWLGGVRVRAAAVSTLAVGAAFALSSLGVLALLRGSLYQSAANTAQDEALIVSAMITSRGHAPVPIPEPAEEIAAQVVGPNGSVITSSRNIADQAAMVDIAPRPGTMVMSTGVTLRVRRFTHVHLDLDERFVVAALGISGPPVRGTVLVAYSLGAADHAINLVRLSLMAGLPALVLFVAVLVWAMTGWALRPGERSRSQVAEMAATDLSHRVVEPAARDEVGELARTMNEMLTRLQTGNERQHQLIADVSHE